jgi:UDP-N-acetylmuramate-alanine ligase
MINAGKSTTAGMLAYVLKAMGDDLTAVIGAHVPQVSFYFEQLSSMYSIFPCLVTCSDEFS